MYSLMPNKHPEADHKNLTCGSCQWFSAGYGGNNCQKIRGAEVLTPACIEYQPVQADPFSVYSRDKYIQGIKVELQKIMSSRVHDNWRSELANYNIDVEKSLNFATSAHSESAAIKESLKTIIGYRFRVTEIMSSVILDESELEKLEEKVYIWLVSKYPEVRDFKNEKLKQVALARAIPEMIDIKSEVNKTLKLAKFIDGKLDKNDATLRDLLKAASAMFYTPSAKM